MREAHPRRRRARRRVGRRGGDPAVGGRDRPRKSPRQLGADVPFCLIGGRARVSGIGEVVEPLSLCRSRVHGGDAAPRRLDPGGVPGVGRAGRAGRRPRQRSRGGGIHVEPGWREWRDRIAEATGQRPSSRAAARRGSSRGITAMRRGARTRDGGGDAHRPLVEGRSAENGLGYLRRWKRVRLSIFLCFFLRMRLRRFLINDPIRSDTLSPRYREGPQSGVVQW